MGHQPLDGAAVADIFKPSALLRIINAVERQYDSQLVDAFPFLTIIALHPDGNAFQRPLLAFGVHLYRDRLARTQRNIEVVMGSGALPSPTTGGTSAYISSQPSTSTRWRKMRLRSLITVMGLCIILPLCRG